jgi:hypothetical protein
MIYPASGKKTGISIFISDKVHLKPKLVRRDTEGCYIIGKGKIPSKQYNDKKFLCSKHWCTQFLFFILVLCGSTLWPLQKFLQCIKYIVFEFISSTVLVYSLSPNSWNSFNRYHFCIHIHVNTVFALDSPSYPLSPPSSHFHWYQPPPTSAGLVLPSYSLIL